MTVDLAPAVNFTTAEDEVTAIRDFYHNTVKQDLFALGEMCAAVIGKYGEGWTLAIAQECGRSKQTVGNWAHAYLMRESVSLSSQLDTTALSPTHFSTLWELQRKYNLSMDKCVGYLRELLAERELTHSWSAKTLTAIVDAEEAKGGNSPSWDGYYKSRANTAILSWWGVLNVGECPDTEMREALREAAKLAEKRMNETQTP